MKGVKIQTWQDVAKKWDNGEIVWSYSLGGLGPGYEQAIQVLVFEIMVAWNATKFILTLKDDKMCQEYLDHCDRIANSLENKVCGFSGAQFGAARMAAFQFMFYGYEEMMDKGEEKRKIQVSKFFPGMESKA